MFFIRDRSNRLVGGPFIPPRGAFPTVLLKPVLAVRAGLSWKQAVVKYCVRRCGAFALGSQSMLGRLPATAAGLFPRPAASKLEVVAVNGIPVWKVAKPETCHPPSSFSAAPFWLRKN